MKKDEKSKHIDILKDNLRTADSWDSDSDYWYKNMDIHISQIIENPQVAFPESVFEMLQNFFPSFEGIDVCVPSSGDNTAVYAFHLLGANVTSVDLSEKQIENGSRFAQKFNWDITFVCDDSTFLSKLKDKSFDLIYTSNGVHVWIPNLSLMYKNFNRILKSKGRYVFFESHPFSRPFDDSSNEIKIIKSYSNVDPIEENGVKRYMWRIQDFVNSIVASDFEVIKMIEFNSSKKDFIKYDYMYNSIEDRVEDNYQKYDWLKNPWAALPQCLGMSVTKKK